MLRETVQHDIDRNNGTFQHGFIRFPRSQALHLQPGPAKNAGGFAVGMCKAHQDFITDAGNNRQHGQMEKKANEEIADRHQHIQHKEKKNADGENNQEKSGTAARMQTGKGLGVTGSQ